MKILPCGVAIVEHDTHVGVWIAQQKRLDIAHNTLRHFKQYVQPGSIVLDIGANVGDHTATYMQWVGAEGCVFAFEPNSEALECLRFNCRFMPNVIIVDKALSDVEQTLFMHTQPNVGASFTSPYTGEFTVEATTLDTCPKLNAIENVSFIKIDAEGYEVYILRGGRELINRNRPAMLVEVNTGALERANSSREELFGELEALGYVYAITDQRLKWDDLQYDILCVPR